MQHQKILAMARIALFAALISVCAILSVPLPLTAVPVSLLTLGLFLAGGLLSPGEAAAAAAIHLLLGAVGVPVFSGFRSGVGTLLGPTGGYLLAGPLVAAIIAWISRYVKKNALGVVIQAAALVAGLAVCYLGGTTMYCALNHISFLQGYLLCVQPFLFADLCKIVAAMLILFAVRAALLHQSWYRKA